MNLKKTATSPRFDLQEKRNRLQKLRKSSIVRNNGKDADGVRWTWRREEVRLLLVSWTPRTRLQPMKKAVTKDVKKTKNWRKVKVRKVLLLGSLLHRDHRLLKIGVYDRDAEYKMSQINEFLREHREHSKRINPKNSHHDHSINQVHVPLNIGRQVVIHVCATSEEHAKQFHTCQRGTQDI